MNFSLQQLQQLDTREARIVVDALGPDSQDFHGTTYGAGVELSPADMGSSAMSSNIRFRVQADTMGNFRSIRPMAGVVAKF